MSLAGWADTWMDTANNARRPAGIRFKFMLIMPHRLIAYFCDYCGNERRLQQKNGRQNDSCAFSQKPGAFSQKNRPINDD
jgi:hypothetical protein